MSYNQSRSDRSETQYRKTGRSTGNHHQQQQQQQHRSSSAAGYGKGAGAPGTAPSPSTYVDSSLPSNRSFKKPSNAQGGGQPRVNLPPVNHSVSKDGLHPNNHNGPNAHTRSQGVSGEPVVGGTANPTESFNRNSGPIPKAPTSQSISMNSKNNETPNTAKASGDASQAFPFQFGSIAPDLMKIPARTSSAPPNMDEQTRAQMQQASLRTAPKFEKLFEQVKSVNIDNAVTLSGVVSQIFDTALMEPTFCEMYAEFCVHLSGVLPDFNENGEKITFKRLLLNKCQEEFERGEKEEEEASRVAEEGQVEQTEEEREEKRLKVRRRMLGNIRLIGELYKKRMLTEKIMHACIQKLLGYNQDPHEENIEALCVLMSTIGVMIDHHKAKIHMDAYFEKMKMLSCKQELSSRVRFMLIHVMDLRKYKWQERMKVEGPK